ncbi:phospholipase [Pseudomonas sp. B21-044]|uniref:phospholipase n=1 Tax=Pseudomonas sp. B21-044 TaxID=2895488 RepID=UPI00215DF88B|nr:phospholipase [Pseudomonas sp. B21-044]UVL20248.1 phospholipase [Pseudomonas sp. B21-044]
MSGMQTAPAAMKAQATLVVADLDQLFDEHGIALPGPDSHLVLVMHGHHTLKYHRPAPPSAGGNAAQRGPELFFEGAEHTAIGDNTLLRYETGQPGTPAHQSPLPLPNGLNLTYGQVIALGGDFYGVPERPIADGGNDAERVERFIQAFDSLARLPAAKAEAEQILAVMQEEIRAANQAIKDGRQPHEAYDALGDSLSARWNRITGGGSFASDLFPLGRYLKLAASNWDHFGPWALLAYQAGHAAALQQALKARASGAERDLQLAYAMNAFADHFLTDLFSAGHLRVPRKALADTVTPSDVGSLISRFMHDEDSKYGLAVRNAEGEQWRAYGDKRYFDSVDVANRRQVARAVQRSADEVFQAFAEGHVPQAKDFSALRLAPDLHAAEQDLVPGNFAPLYFQDGKAVLRRKDVNDLNDRNRIDDWWGWSTYLLLKDYKPNKPTGFIDAPATSPVITGWERREPDGLNWQRGNAVRYAFSITDHLNESYIGPWSGYAELTDQFHPSVQVPADGKQRGRNLFRQFRGGSPELIASLDGKTTLYIDRNA